MGIRKKQHTASTSDTTSPARPACIQHADTIRRKARHYTNITEQTGNQSDDRHTASQKREQAEREMAALRAEAVQARRLAAQIENLHRPVHTRQKDRLMTTAVSDPGQAQRMTRREIDIPHSTGGQLSFNPLHPSMELPPEQLIRLLGLDDKTRRRKKRSASAVVSSGKQRPVSQTPDESAKLKLPVTPPARAEREKDMASTPFREPHRQLIIASLVAGTLAGLALSIYLFLGNPEEMKVTAAQNAPLQTSGKTLHRPPATSEVRHVIPAPAADSVTPPPKPDRQGTAFRANAIPRTDIETEQRRLRDEAEKRFAERIQQQGNYHERETLMTEPVVAGPEAVINTPSVQLSAPAGAATEPVQELATPLPESEATTGIETGTSDDALF